MHCIGGSHALKRRAVCSVWSVFTARKAYENINKENAIMIQIWDDEVDERTTDLLDEYKNWEEIEDVPELFIVDKDWK